MATDNRIRQSNIELLRIILMILVIAHHYVVNSGVMDQFNYFSVSAPMIYLQCFGAFGKVAINAFVLITGYFMCSGHWTIHKWIKLYLQIKLYRIVFYLLFVAVGYVPFNYHDLLETLFSTVFQYGSDYAETYLGLYLMIPFLNKLITSLTQREHSYLLLLLLAFFCLIPTFSLFLSVRHASNDTWNYPVWMAVLYLTGAYIRKYSFPAFLSKNWARTAFFLNCALIFGSIIVVDFVGVRLDFTAQYWLVNNANKLLAYTCAIAIFFWFKDLQISYHPVINTISACTFGIYLIHTVNPAMREWLWCNLFRVSDVYHTSYVWFHSVASVVLIFATCASIEWLRLQLFNKVIKTH